MVHVEGYSVESVYFANCQQQDQGETIFMSLENYLRMAKIHFSIDSSSLVPSRTHVVAAAGDETKTALGCLPIHSSGLYSISMLAVSFFICDNMYHSIAVTDKSQYHS